MAEGLSIAAASMAIAIIGVLGGYLAWAIIIMPIVDWFRSRSANRT